MTRYWDSSALAKRYVHEPGSQQVSTLLKEGPGATSRFTEVEVASALSRRTRERALTVRNRDRALHALHQDMSVLYVVEITTEIIDHALRLLTQYALRAADALQLASCLYLEKALQGDIELVSFDHLLKETAVQEGIRLWQE